MAQNSSPAIQEILEETKKQGVSRRLRVWHSSIPLVIHHQNQKLRLDIPRLSYLPLTFAKVRQHFSIAKDFDLYLALCKTSGSLTENVVRVHLPVGLLYDLHAEVSTIWNLYVLTESPTFEKGYPYPRIQKIEELRPFVWNSLKHNESLRQSTVRRIQNLTTQQTKDFYLSMLSLDFLAYWRLAHTFMNLERLRSFPVRLYLGPRTFNPVTTKIATIQGLVPTRIDGHLTTVRDCAKILLHRLQDEYCDPRKLEIISHGTVISWDESLGDLLEEEQYVDGWLYLTISQRRYHTSQNELQAP